MLLYPAAACCTAGTCHHRVHANTTPVATAAGGGRAASVSELRRPTSNGRSCWAAPSKSQLPVRAPLRPLDPAIVAAAAAAAAAAAWGPGGTIGQDAQGQEVVASDREDQGAESVSHAASTSTSTAHALAQPAQSSGTASFHTSPSASLTRMLLMAPTPSLRALTNRKWRLTGPMSFLLFLLGLFLAIMAAVRSVLVRRVKACKTCKSYGVIRCRLCNGQGSVLWRGKVNHEETCPLCLTRRYVTCPDCGGHYHRSMFVHKPNRSGRGLIPDFLLKMNG